MNSPLAFIVIVLIWVALAVVAVLLTSKPVYQCPSGKAVALTVARHGDALPVLSCLSAAGIDAQVAEETSKAFLRRLLYRCMIVGYLGEPPGPWHVVVPRSDLVRAQSCLGQ